MASSKSTFLFVFLLFNVYFTDCCLITNATRSKFSFHWPHWPSDQIVRKTTEDVIKSAGYPVETHSVRTNDSYWLTMHRIPRGKEENENWRKGSPGCKTLRQVVLLHHGMLCSSAAWVASGPRNGLAFILADAGYDVWMLNARGNTYSRKHDYLDYKLDAAKFWNFSFHEMGVYDLPAQIDYIIDATGQPKVFYIGYSMGTTAFYIMASTHPKYNDKIRGMVSLAPIAYLEHVKSKFVHILQAIEPMITPVLSALNVYDILPQNRPCDLLNKYICSHPRYYRLCELAVESLSGYDHEQYDYHIVSAFLDHFPAGTSWKVFQHYFQLIRGARFNNYDYGWVENKRIYGTETPPDYNLKAITTPVFLITGENDLLSVKEDVKKLEQELSSVIAEQPIWYKKFSHADFMWAKDVRTMVYNNLTEILARYGPGENDIRRNRIQIENNIGRSV